MNEPFRPTRAIVTAADSGIGRATADARAAAGMDVGLTWHTDEQGARDTPAHRDHQRARAPAEGRSAAYDAAKHALGGLMKTIAIKLGQYGITANSVAPGEIATPMTGQTDEDPPRTHRPGVPLGRPGDAREIAAVVAFLASPAASYVRGASYAVDGGMLQTGPQAGSHITSDDWRSV